LVLESEQQVKSRLLTDEPKSFVLVFQTGDEVNAQLSAFAKQHGLTAAHFSAIGALSGAKLGYFDWESKKYLPNEINEQVEVLSFLGDVALDQGQPKVHAHMVVGKRDGTAWGGHVIEAHVRPTLELILEESPVHLRKKVDPESGLALISLDE
jgi:predicted DNA-binding protein with PD1-like motif